MKLTHSLMTLMVATALLTAAAAPAMTETDVRALLIARGYSKIEHVELTGNVWTAKGTTAVGNEFDLRVDPNTLAVSIDYEGNHDNADVPANGLTQDAITARLQAGGYRGIQNVEFENGVWTAQVLDINDKMVWIDLDPNDGSVLRVRD